MTYSTCEGSSRQTDQPLDVGWLSKVTYAATLPLAAVCMQAFDWLSLQFAKRLASWHVCTARPSACLVPPTHQRALSDVLVVLAAEALAVLAVVLPLKPCTSGGAAEVFMQTGSR